MLPTFLLPVNEDYESINVKRINISFLDYLMMLMLLLPLHHRLSPLSNYGHGIL